MKKIFVSILYMALHMSAQDITLMDYLLYPRLDSSHWNADYEILNSNYSKIANRCQTCVFTQTDTTRGRFCFNTSMGHVQMDTTIHHVSKEKLLGRWEVIDYGIIEVTDSLIPNSKIYLRYSKILNAQKEPLGFVSFTEKHFKTSLKNLEDIPNRRGRYKILEGKYLATRKLTAYCGATTVGMPNDSLLILDDHTFRTLAHKDKYMIVKTSIRRIIFKKSLSP